MTFSSFIIINIDNLLSQLSIAHMIMCLEMTIRELIPEENCFPFFQQPMITWAKLYLQFPKPQKKKYTSLSFIKI